MPAVKERVSGHWLLSEGAAFTHVGSRRWPSGTAGPGYGRCSCGAMSDWLDTGAARKRWHREHKAEVLYGQGGTP